MMDLTTVIDRGLPTQVVITTEYTIFTSALETTHWEAVKDELFREATKMRTMWNSESQAWYHDTVREAGDPVEAFACIHHAEYLNRFIDEPPVAS